MVSLNRRRLLALLGSTAGTAALAGCTGGDGGDGGNGGDGGSGDDSSGDGGSGDGSSGDGSSDGGNGDGDSGDGGGGDGLEARAREEGSMTFYSVIDEAGMRNTILPPFRETYDWLEFNLVSQGPSNIASSMSTEYQTGNVQSDAAINTQGTMSPLVDVGVFREPDPDGELMQFVTENYPDDSYTLPAIPGYLFPIQVMYHTERVSEDEIPTGYDDFASSALEGRIAMDNPAILNVAGGQLATLRDIWGADTWRENLEAINANSPVLTESSSESSRLLVQGEVDVIIGSLSDTLALQEDGEPVEGLWLEPTVALNLPIYLSADSDNPNAAELFATWFLSEEGQRAVAETGRVPARGDIAAEEFEGTIPSEVEILPVAYNDQSYYNDPETWIERYEEIFG